MKVIATATLLGSLIAGAGAVDAMPLTPAGDTAAVIRVAAGCGPGLYRSPSGACRPAPGGPVVAGPASGVARPRVCSPGFVVGRDGRCRPI